MEVNVQVICREIIKPSSPTPQHLKRMKVSYLDQIVTNIYRPHVLFFQAHKSKGLTNTQISQQMKQSLSNILTSFYPLAGRVQADDLAIDCNDARVEFVTAQTHAHLSDVIKDPDLEDLKKYIPIDPVVPEERSLFNVQITFFDCGGISLGVYYSHIIIDCYSLLMFLNTWASICRGEPEVLQSVSFDMANYFPAREFRSPIFSGHEAMSKEKCSIKRFVFNKEIITYLKGNVVTSSRSRVKDPTRVAVVSAFIWKHFIDAANSNSPKTFFASHIVNLRGRNNLPHSLQNTIGNCIIPCFASVDATQVSSELHELVSKLRCSIRRIDGDYIKELQMGNRFVDELTSLKAKGELKMCIFSSWCRLPVYVIDFGFGTPIWYCTASLPIPNSAIFISTKSGDEIEAWINMEQASLEILATKINLISNAL